MIREKEIGKGKGSASAPSPLQPQLLDPSRPSFSFYEYIFICRHETNLDQHRKTNKLPHFYTMELFDYLHCSEHHWEDEAEEEHDLTVTRIQEYCEEEELASLLSKQEYPENVTETIADMRLEAVNWILKVIACYDFAALTAVLAVNYLDIFLVRLRPQPNQPWVGQLAAVACLSLAAKVEETHVPLLLDFQVEGTKYVFEAKTIQRIELRVLSTLQWKMNPVTPVSFVDYITRKLGLKDHLCSEFLRRCDHVLLSLLSETRLLDFLPSVVAASTILQVSATVHPSLRPECETLILDMLENDKERVAACCKFILESESNRRQSGKRKFGGAWEVGSPRGVMECVCFSSDSCNDSWAASPPSVSSSPEPHLKKIRAQTSFL